MEKTKQKKSACMLVAALVCCPLRCLACASAVACLLLLLAWLVGCGARWVCLIKFVSGSTLIAIEAKAGPTQPHCNQTINSASTLCFTSH